MRTIVGLPLLVVLGGVFFLCGRSYAQPALPLDDAGQHLGAVTCAGSTCHGATQPFADSPVLQNEYITWVRQDSHANAYNVLLNDQSRRIARNLGLAAAHTSDQCLDCHTDNVPEQRRGNRFQIDDGVSCEACHGGSENWLGSHTSGKSTHQDNIAAGMYPTENPLARAKLCLSCHFGTGDRFVDHRIMGAGHPRMSFELDTFTAVQPAHFQVDADYRERKGSWSGAQTWALGQSVAAETFLQELLDKKLGQKSGLFPELVFFDCFACHHSLNNTRWGARRITGLGPGAVRLNDSSLLMLQQIMQRVEPALGADLRQEITSLHQATLSGRSAVTASAERLLGLTRDAQKRLAAHRFSGDDMSAMLQGLIELGRQGEQRDYAAAEQGVMGIGSIVNSLAAANLIANDRRSQVTAALDKLYAALANEDTYKNRELTAALQLLQNSYK